MSWSHLLTGVVALPLGVFMLVKHRVVGLWYGRVWRNLPLWWRGIAARMSEEDISRLAGFSAIPAGCILIVVGVVQITEGLP